MRHLNENKQLNIILLIVFLSFVSASIPYPIFSPLFLSADQSIVPSSWDVYHRNILLGLALAVYPFGLFLGSPILGSASDYFGRKPILVLSLAASAIGHLLTGVALVYHSIILMIVFRFLTGLMEGHVAIAQAMVCDFEYIIKEHSIGKINAVGSIGYILGPLLGGVFSDSNLSSLFSYALPFILAAILTLVALFLSMSYLADQTIKNNNIFNLSKKFNLKIKFKKIAINKNLKYLFMISIIYTIGVDIFYEFSPVYLTSLWDMTPISIAYYNISLSFGLVIGSGFIPKILSKLFKSQFIILSSLAITSLFIGILMCYPNKIILILLFGIIGIGIGIGTTLLVVAISNATASNIQGEILGTLHGIRMLGDAMACIIGGVIIISMATLPMAISSLFALIALVGYRKFLN